MGDKGVGAKRQQGSNTKVGAASMKTKRDDFRAATVLKIRDMAGNVCSMPECHVSTHGSKRNRDGALSVGVACHIRAAAPGGPRYDPEQTPDQRKHEDNGIWMCQTHSRMIDSDDSPYPPEVLLEWKRLAEIRANGMVNKRAFTPSEASDLARTESIALLDRFTNRTGDPIESPIREMLEGYEAGLESLDPRFEVEVSRKGKSLHHVISPVVDDVKIQLIISNIDDLAGFLEGEKALFEEGRELVIPSPNFEFKGSKLFEAIHQRYGGAEGGSLTLGAIKQPVKTNIYACDLQGHELLLESFTSYSITGAVRSVIEGTCLGGFLILKTIVDHVGGGSNLDLTLSLEPWRGMDILDIPLFFRLLKAMPYLADGNLIVEFEVGNDVARFNTSQSSEADAFVGHIHWVIRFLNEARQIAKNCARRITLKEIDFSPEVFKTLFKYNRLVGGPAPAVVMPAKLCVGNFDCREGATLEDLFDAERTVIQVKQVQERKPFHLFGQTITPPAIETTFTDLDCFPYCPVDDRTVVKLELHIIDNTLVEQSLIREGAWPVRR